MSFYLKYRPRTVSELDLDVVRESLENIFKSQKMAHAYLFVGPRGAGKTSAARILAKVVNCQKSEKIEEPCLNCEMCKSIENGSAIDLIEIDAASHRGIDAMRELREKIGLSPVMGTKKVYIIDEVHMLTVEAFNALLKTLEEPPDHAVFVLCTTEDYKVPETVVSRCVKVQFVKANTEEVKRSLLKAITGEGLSVVGDALEYLATRVDGSFREGHKLLEQLAALGSEIDTKMVMSVLGVVTGVDPKRLGELLLLGDSKASLEEIEKADHLGVAFEPYAKEVVEFLRLELRASFGMGERRTNMDTNRVKLVLEKTASACREMKSAVIEQVPLEILAVELGRVRVATTEIEELSVKKKSLQERQKPLVEEVEVIEDVIVPEVKIVEPEVADEEEADVLVGDVSVESINSEWDHIVDELKPLNHSVAGLLRSAKPKAVEGGTLILEVFYKFHKDQLEQEAKRRLLEEVMRKKVGIGKIRCVLGEKTQEVLRQLPEHDNITVVKEDQKLAEMVEEVFL